MQITINATMDELQTVVYDFRSDFNCAATRWSEIAIDAHECATTICKHGNSSPISFCAFEGVYEGIPCRVEVIRDDNAE